MTVLSKEAREALRVIHALRKSPAPEPLQKKAEAAVMNQLKLADVIAVSTALFEEESRRTPQTGGQRG
jgi:hypothetical protein